VHMHVIVHISLWSSLKNPITRFELAVSSNENEEARAHD